MMIRILLLLEMALSFPKTQGDTVPVLWPAGRYGLPRPQSGCPRNSGITWATGTRFQALKGNSQRSISLHLNASVSSDGVDKSYCIKSSTGEDVKRPKWPPGQYCIYMKGDECPSGMQYGFFFWDDRLVLSSSDRRNSRSGALPAGQYDSNTLIDFCCYTSGDALVPISLPMDSPFYLMPYGSTTCQKVKACRYDLTSLVGTIESPFYPSNYPNHIDCYWRITVLSNHSNYRFTFTFENFTLDSSVPECNTRCTCDWLRVTGSNQAGSVSRVYCAGSHRPPVVMEMNGYSTVMVYFRSDATGTAAGFKISYVATPIAPTSQITTPTPISIMNTTTANNITTAAHNNTSTEQWDFPTTERDIKTTTQPAGLTPSGHEEAVSTHSTREVVIHKAKQRGKGSKDWVIGLVVALVVMVIAVLLGLVYKRRQKRKDDKLRGRLTVRYSQNIEDELNNITRSSTIDMYSGDPVELDDVPVTKENHFYGTITRSRGDSISKTEPKQESENPLYAGIVNIACEVDDDHDDISNQEANQDSDNPLYGNENRLKITCEEVSKDSATTSMDPIYSSLDKDYVTLDESLPGSEETKSENPLYESLT